MASEYFLKNTIVLLYFYQIVVFRTVFSFYCLKTERDTGDFV